MTSSLENSAASQQLQKIEDSESKVEVTLSDYCAFLNAEATTDSLGLYEEKMEGLLRQGEAGNYYYEVLSGEEGALSYADQASLMQYCNWRDDGRALAEVASDPLLKSHQIQFQVSCAPSDLWNNHSLGKTTSGVQIARNLFVILVAYFSPAATSDEGRSYQAIPDEERTIQTEEGGQSNNGRPLRSPLDFQERSPSSRSVSMYGSINSDSGSTAGDTDSSSLLSSPEIERDLETRGITTACHAAHSFSSGVGTFEGHQITRSLESYERRPPGETTGLLSSSAPQNFTANPLQKGSLASRHIADATRVTRQGVLSSEVVDPRRDFNACDAEMRKAQAQADHHATFVQQLKMSLVGSSIEKTSDLQEEKSHEDFWKAKVRYWKAKQAGVLATASSKKEMPSAEESVSSRLMGVSRAQICKLEIAHLDEVLVEVNEVAQAYDQLATAVHGGHQTAPDVLKKEWSSFLKSVKQEQTLWKIESLSVEANKHELQASHALVDAYHVLGEESRSLWIWNKAITNVEGVIQARKTVMESQKEASESVAGPLQKWWKNDAAVSERKISSWKQELLNLKARRAGVIITTALEKQQEALATARKAHGETAISAWGTVIQETEALGKACVEAKEVYQTGMNNVSPSLKPRWKELLANTRQTLALQGPQLQQWKGILRELKNRPQPPSTSLWW